MVSSQSLFSRRRPDNGSLCACRFKTNNFTHTIHTLEIFENHSLLKHNTFGIDAKCSRFIDIASTEEASRFLPQYADDTFIIVGGGSNLLLTRDYEGTVLHSAIRGIEVEDDGDSVLVTCGSGEVWDDVVAHCVREGLHGAENLSLIPGDVGASAVQNIGAYGSEAKDIICKVEAVEIATGNVMMFNADDCHYSYRQSIFKNEWKNRFFITHVTYRLSRQFQPRLEYGNIKSALADKGIVMPTAQQLRDVIIEIRKAKLPEPSVLGNAGSFFMNPVVDKAKYEQLLSIYPQMPHYTIDAMHEKIPAGWMIEQCGWKGKEIGEVAVWKNQALVITNKGNASGQEIFDVSQQIIDTVFVQFGIKLEREVNIL